MYFGDCGSTTTYPVYTVYGSSVIAFLSTMTGYHKINIKNIYAYDSQSISFQIDQSKSESSFRNTLLEIRKILRNFINL